MLRLMLDSNPLVAIPGESHFIPSFWMKGRRYLSGGDLDAQRLAGDIMRTRHFKLWQVPEEDVLGRVRRLERPTFAEVIDALFMAYAEQHGKERWGDKTPIYVHSIPLLARLFPEARFVHLIRDGRDVALSYLSVPWGPATIWQAARKWRADVSAGRRAGRSLQPGRYLEVHYEHLVREPAATLEKVCSLADLPFSERMLEYHRDGIHRLQAPPDGVPFHASSAKPPTRGLRDWRSEMSWEQIAAFEAVAGELLSELDYERGCPDPSWARRMEAWGRVKGRDIFILGSRIKRRMVVAVTRRSPAGMRVR
jgi:hypothetical protein